MKSNGEIRNLAWRRLWADRWLSRLVGGMALLGLCGYAVQFVLGGILATLNVQSWIDYMQAVADNGRDLTTPIPNLTSTFIFQATTSTALIFFLGYIMAGIAAYGGAVILLRCVRNEENGWLGAAFGGFAMPFGLLWLFVRYLLVLAGWTFIALGVPGLIAGVAYPFARTLPTELLAVAAGAGVAAALCWAIFVYCIPFYRYRFLWLVKAEHPDWGAGACMQACRDMMKGNMMRSVRLDCSYWKSIALLLLGLVISAFNLLAFVVWFFAIIVIAQYVRVGQCILYRELVGERL